MGRDVMRTNPDRYRASGSDPTANLAVHGADNLNAVTSPPVISGLKPMRPDRLHALYLEGAPLEPEELLLVAHYVNEHPHLQHLKPRPNKGGMVQTLPNIA